MHSRSQHVSRVITGFLKERKPGEILTGSSCPYSGDGRYEFGHLDRVGMSSLDMSSVVVSSLRDTIRNDSTACIVTFENDMLGLNEFYMEVFQLMLAVDAFEEGAESGDDGLTVDDKSFFGFMMSNLYPRYHPRELPYSALVFTDDEKIRRHTSNPKIALGIRIDSLLRVAKAYNEDFDIERAKEVTNFTTSGGKLGIEADSAVVSMMDRLVMAHYFRFGYNKLFARPFNIGDMEDMIRKLICG